MDFDLKLYFICAIPGFLLEMINQLTKHSSRDNHSQSKSKSKDHGTFYVIWIIIMCAKGLTIHYVRLGYGWKIFTNSYYRFLLSIPLSAYLLMTGRSIRQQSIEQLGKWFTMKVCTNDDQQLIQTGWYSKMRHPSYTGILMIFTGLALLMNNWLGLIGIVGPTTLTFLYRIYFEEKELNAHFGASYDEYRRKVPAKLIPYIF